MCKEKSVTGKIIFKWWVKEASFYINDTEYRSKGGERVKKKLTFLQHREGKNIYHSREKELSQRKQRIFVMGEKGV